MPHGFNDDRSKNNLSDFALNEDLNDYVPKDELKDYVLGLVKDGTHDNIIAQEAPITIHAGEWIQLTRNFGTLNGRRAISFNGVQVLMKLSSGTEQPINNVIPVIDAVWTDSDNVCYMKMHVKSVAEVDVRIDIIRLYYTYIDL